MTEHASPAYGGGRQQAEAAAPPETGRVFVIDDDDIMLLSCRRILEKAGYQVETFSSGLEGIRRIKDVRPELLLVDLKMPELDGLQVIERVRAVDPDVVIAVITGYATIATAVDAMKAGAYDFLPKPFTPDELRLIVNRGPRAVAARDGIAPAAPREGGGRAALHHVRLPPAQDAARRRQAVPGRPALHVEGRDDAEDAGMARARAGRASTRC